MRGSEGSDRHAEDEAAGWNTRAGSNENVLYSRDLIGERPEPGTGLSLILDGFEVGTGGSSRAGFAEGAAADLAVVAADDVGGELERARDLVAD